MIPFLLLLSIFFLLTAQAQVDVEKSPVTKRNNNSFNNKTIQGKCIDAVTRKGIELVTVQLYAYLQDSVSAEKDTLVSVMFTKSNGDFNFSNLPQADSFRVTLSGVGYEKWEKNIILKRRASIIDLGNISLKREAQVLESVSVTAQRPALQMDIDRKVFSIENSIVATGGTALDVIRNIPSVSVDVEGNVLLRNVQPQIFVDGHPTILSLDQIPADQIDRVELITNPSAKFDATSSARIINIVLKRNRRVGLNGIATVGGGHPDLLNGNLTLNARQGKFNVFAIGSYNRQGGMAKGKTLRQNKVGGAVSNYFNQVSWNDINRRFSSVRFGVDFFASNRSTISLTQNIVGGKFSNNEEQDQEYLNSSHILERFGEREAEGRNQFDRYNSQLNYTHKFPEQGKELSANFNYSWGEGSEVANIVNRFFRPDGSPLGVDARVRNKGSNNFDQYIFQVDFVDPTGNNSKLESGLRSYINRQTSYFSSFSLNNGSETLLPLSNNYSYDEMVNAAYITYSNKIKTFSYQAGLRVEVSQFEGELIDSAQKFGYDYPSTLGRLFDALFPSLFLTKQVSDHLELQVNYTRRIQRPGFWQLNPFVDISDPQNLRQGNPELKPEFINSFELNYNQKYKKGNFLGVLYFRNNQSDITRYSDTISASQYQQLNNAAIDTNAILNTFINARYTNYSGLELTLQHRFDTHFDIVPTVNLQHRNVKADVGELRLINKGFNWEGKLTLNYNFGAAKNALLNDLRFQLIGAYESREVTAQGRNVPQNRLDFALRKDFLKDNKASFTFNINDVFNSYRFGNIYDTETFYQESYRRRNVRTFRASLTYKFGMQDFSLPKRPDNRSEDREEE
ncbi:TonB-dependent receptor family protein [Chitinophagaceae bacterium LB-8]|uniref:TonB-dependent receptor family protein n=1 Tax=Paraflavisolibacter caeni TaxID=2982496 RepID=A0A9X2XTP7_9BACT|nr:outer membrane beta-barrel family protein [Paraflavisolibacter caeni]MCU7548206.1 TonB-dependent receptor family protein [Paraflavisolibacter caeni]